MASVVAGDLPGLRPHRLPVQTGQATRVRATLPGHTGRDHAHGPVRRPLAGVIRGWIATRV